MSAFWTAEQKRKKKEIDTIQYNTIQYNIGVRKRKTLTGINNNFAISNGLLYLEVA